MAVIIANHTSSIVIRSLLKFEEDIALWFLYFLKGYLLRLYYLLFQKLLNKI